MRGPLKNSPFLLEGGSQAVLLVHGLGGGPYEVQRLAEVLHAQKGLTCSAIHLPGHDRPSPLMPSSRWEDWYAHVEAAYRALRAEYSTVHVVGFSTGCPLLLNLAQEERIAGRMVLLAPFVRVARPRFLPWSVESILEVAQRTPLLRALRQVPGRPPPLSDRVARRAVQRVAHFKTFNIEAVASALILIRKVMGALFRVDVPTLILQGERDTVVDPQGARTLYEGLVCERELEYFPSSDHLLLLDEDRDQVMKRAIAFLPNEAHADL